MPGQSAKGNPAHTRQANTKKKDLRTRSFSRGEVRKQERRKRQEDAHQRNKIAGGPTPWQQSKAKRYKARAGIREAWQKRQSSQ
jgi:hypothetical protein